MAIALAVADLRQTLGWTQAELGRRAHLSQSFVSRVEHALLPDLSLVDATRLLEAMGARLTVGVSAQFLTDRELQRDPAHARCSAYVAARLKSDGWLMATEVEIGGDRSRGWIDLLAYHPDCRLMLVIEIKTEIRDLGAIERTLGWYEREAVGRGAAIGLATQQGRRLPLPAGDRDERGADWGQPGSVQRGDFRSGRRSFIGSCRPRRRRRARQHARWHSSINVRDDTTGCGRAASMGGRRRRPTSTTPTSCASCSRDGDRPPDRRRSGR
jgi:transcriptional regulator with XRE-family HTH domain